ncbi:cell division protein ZapD [Idiomarina abyssalis]|uniref:cell division protein ZapD n=1 Tax=Idiomarina abyssalis TaxID=86102 RepID=UPI0006C89B89|nr:cell division protein ZapD [Idiomarina abyssalis]KPD21329.1 cell division protein ZapD [Idiomarina abyssalis]SFT70827.1 cell division protein ZapD [Idiomarina abyssalis]
MASTDNDNILYEYPLQERMRTYLRLEHGFEQLKASQLCFEEQAEPFFNALFAVTELLERFDIRTELSKDLDLDKQRLQKWEAHPDVDREALRNTIQEIEQCLNQLQDIPKYLRQLKDDALLASIRQRFSQPGMSGLFELPQLQLWLSQSTEDKAKQCEEWRKTLAFVELAITLKLTLLREQSVFVPMQLQNGFLQESSDQLLAMLRIKVPRSANIYPVISGHRQRFTVRFMPLPGESNETSLQDIEFEIARCSP